MEKEDLKKSWVAPELVVLVRNKTEEAVLMVCKNFDLALGDNFSNEDCATKDGGCVTCMGNNPS